MKGEGEGRTTKGTERGDVTGGDGGEHDTAYALVEAAEEGALDSAGLGVGVESGVVGGLDAGFDGVEGVH